MRLPWSSRSAAAPAPADTAPVAVPSLGNGLTVPIRPADYPGLLESLRAPSLPDPAKGFLVGWDGVRTRVSMLPFAPSELSGTVSTDLPIPDDGYRSEDAEYVALARLTGAPLATLDRDLAERAAVACRVQPPG